MDVLVLKDAEVHFEMENAAKINTAHREAVYFLQVLLTLWLTWT